MEYPLALLLPFLMLLDYFATVLGAQRIRDGYDRHFVFEHYEMNPVWQESVAQSRWLNPRHLGLTIAYSALLIAALELGAIPEFWSEVILGATVGTFVILVSRHVQNLLTYRYVARNPGEVSGTVSISHPMMLSLSALQHMAIAVPLVTLAVVTASPITMGVAIGAVALAVAHVGWIKQARAALRQ